MSPGNPPHFQSFFFGMHLLKNIFYFPLLFFKGIYHYWTYFPFLPRAEAMDLMGSLPARLEDAGLQLRGGRQRGGAGRAGGWGRGGGGLWLCRLLSLRSG